jgi:hypothetical protein
VRPAGLPVGEAGNVVDLELFPALTARALDRPLYSSSSCGVCGKRSIASLEIPAPPLPPGFHVRRSVLASLPTRMRAPQPNFDRTGGLHACALFDADGALLCLREDVGRHNAVDKVVGWALEARRVPLAAGVLLVSGRISFELAQKAVIAGAPVLAAVGRLVPRDRDRAAVRPDPRRVRAVVRDERLHARRARRGPEAAPPFHAHPARSRCDATARPAPRSSCCTAGRARRGGAGLARALAPHARARAVAATGAPRR